MNRIDSFQGPYRFLSNFWPAVVRYEGVEYPSVEHAYQAAKSNNPETRHRIKLALTAGKAKLLGRRIPRHELSPYWDAAKIGVMDQLVVQKFGCHADLCRRLIATYPCELIEGNIWGDKFWGVCKGEGENHLGRILMEVRHTLMAGSRIWALRNAWPVWSGSF